VVVRIAGGGMADVAVGCKGGALGSDQQLDDRFSRRFVARMGERPGRQECVRAQDVRRSC